MAGAPVSQTRDRAELLLRLAVHTGLLEAEQAGELFHRVVAGGDLRALLVQTQAATAEELDALDDVLAGMIRRGTAATLPRLLTSAATVAVGDRAIGEQLGPYRLGAEIGRGGMAIVYRARHEGLQQDVALKVIRPGLEGDLATVARFRLEAQAAAALAGHPGIVAARDVGEAGGRPYFVMDLVEGASLDDLSARGDCSFRTLSQHVADAARALHYAHTQGILHRDVKPGNILVGTDGRVRLTDFGLAKHTAATQGELTALTRAGAVLGTPAYMSPEQAAGRPLDARSDVFSLGVSLWQTCTGVVPYAGESMERILARVVEQELPPPRRLNAAVPPDLETITLRCCELDPARRYPSAEALADDLDRFARGEPIAARRPSAWERWQRHVRRNRAPWTAGALAVATVAIATGVLWWRASAAWHAQVADLQAARLLTATDPERALGLLDSLATQAPGLPGLTEARSAAETRRAGLAREQAIARAEVPLAQGRRALEAYRAADAELARLPAGGSAATRAAVDPTNARAEEGTNAAADIGRRRAAAAAVRERHYVVAWAAFQTVRELLDAFPDAAPVREATIALGDLATARLLEAEGEGDVYEAERFATDLRGLHDPRHDELLRGDGTLSLTTDPPGASVEAWRCEDRDGRLTEVRHGDLGTTPLADVSLPMGSWILILRHPGYADVRYPVLIERTARVDVAMAVPLLTAAQIGDGYIYVPPGESIVGGDPHAYDSGARRRIQLAGFCLRQREVTFAEYRAFVQAALDTGLAPDRAMRLIPRTHGREPVWAIRDGRLEPTMPIQDDWPVTGLGWFHADAYCQWRSHVEGRRVTVPHEYEWERAARGADGRQFPWGNGFDWSWTVGARSPVMGASPEPRPVGSSPVDRSPFGVLDLGGNVRECCAPAEDVDRGGLVAARGGSWGSSSPNDFRSAQRGYGARTAVSFSVGIRCRAEPYPR